MTNDDLEKLIRNAHIFLRRSDMAAAEQECNKALTIDPENVDALEMLGDIAVQRGDTQGAAELYHRAMKLDPKAEGPELKYARIVLNLSMEAEQARALEAAAVPPPTASQSKRNPMLALLASALWPGLGQWYNGEITKAAILAIAYGVAFLILLSTGQLSQMLGVFLSVAAPGQVTGTDPRQVGVLSTLVWGGGAFAWLYAVIDAPLRANRPQRPGTASYTEPDF